MIEAMRKALEALEMLLTLDTHDEMHLLETDIAPKAIIALKQAIEQAEKHEPVGYWDGEFSKDGGAVLYEMPQNEVFMVHPNIPLYAHPAQPEQAPEWVGLTDDDIESIIYGMIDCKECGVTGIARLVEKVLKEKNHGV